MTDYHDDWLPNVAKCKLCGYQLIGEEIIDHVTIKHKKEWLKSLKSLE